jgi:hypothetical protein
MTSNTYNTTTSQRCWDCGKDYPPTTDYFYKDKSRARGLTHACKECIKARANKWNHTHKAKRKRYSKGYYDRYLRSTGAQSPVRERQDREAA